MLNLFQHPVLHLPGARHAELVSASSPPPPRRTTSWTLKQVQGDEGGYPQEKAPKSTFRWHAPRRRPSLRAMARPCFKLEKIHPEPLAGVDEAGCAPLAGPVVAAAVVLDRNHFPRGIDDS